MKVKLDLIPSREYECGGYKYLYQNDVLYVFTAKGIYEPSNMKVSTLLQMDFTLLPKKVSMQEALEAWADGKEVQALIQGKYRTDITGYKTIELAAANVKEMIWYILD